MLLGIMERLARIMAVLGGLVLIALILLTCASVLGRSLNGVLHSDAVQSIAGGLADWLLAAGVGPVNGDFEILEAGVAFAIFAFFPYCQLHGGHATVDVFTSFLPTRVNAWIIAFWEVVLTLVIILISWRLYEGLLGKMSNNQTTFLLQFPVWWAYMASFIASAVAALVGVYCAIARVVGLITGKPLMPRPEGAAH